VGAEKAEAELVRRITLMTRSSGALPVLGQFGAGSRCQHGEKGPTVGKLNCVVLRALAIVAGCGRISNGIIASMRGDN
jgi:hypothetical protein